MIVGLDSMTNRFDKKKRNTHKSCSKLMNTKRLTSYGILYKRNIHLKQIEFELIFIESDLVCVCDGRWLSDFLFL